MASRDIFMETPQPQARQRPGTPSMTPTRSVQRRSSFAKRQSNMPIFDDRESNSKSVPCSTKTQPVLHKEFYDLRTRQVPLSNDIDDLLAHPQNNPGTLEVTRQNNKPKYSINLHLTCLMVLSAFLGAMCYAHVQQYFFNPPTCFQPLQIAQDLQLDRPTNQPVQPNPSEKLVLQLSEEIKDLRDHLSMLQERGSKEIMADSQKGILEELLTADLACAGNLGRVVATPDTTTVTVPATVTLLGLLSFSVRVNHKPPQTTLEGLIQEVGDCWPFEGSLGRLVVRLHRRSLVSAVSISHIPPSLSASGDISSAPRLFQVLVHQTEDDLNDGRVLGQFEYKITGAWRQTFPLQPLKSEVDVVEFRFLENHGHPNYTCVYRVHVHGSTPNPL